MLSIPIVETLVGAITTVMGKGGLLALFLLMIVASFGIPPLPSEIILPFAGFLIFSGDYGWAGALVAALAGVLVGAYFAYAVGRWGRHLLERPTGWVRLDPKHLAAVDRWFHRHGEGTVIFSNMLPIVRGYISYPAGTARMQPARFGLYTFAGNAPYTFALMYAGYYLGERWSVVESYFHVADYLALVAIAGLLVYIALRWRGFLTEGFPPRLTRSSGSPRPEEGATPSATDPGSPPR
jgi:membrane protein DedA with SNARE-associated domain